MEKKKIDFASRFHLYIVLNDVTEMEDPFVYVPVEIRKRFPNIDGKQRNDEKGIIHVAIRTFSYTFSSIPHTVQTSYIRPRNGNHGSITIAVRKLPRENEWASESEHRKREKERERHLRLRNTLVSEIYAILRMAEKKMRDRNTEWITIRIWHS